MSKKYTATEIKTVYSAIAAKGDKQSKYSEPPLVHQDGQLTVTRTRTLAGPIKSWRWKIANGYDATSLLSVNDSDYHIVPGEVFALRHYDVGVTHNYDYSRQTGRIVSTLALPSSPSGLSESKADSDALAKLINQAKEARTALQGLVSVGELGEALRMIRNPLKSLFTKKLPSYHEVVTKRLRGIGGQAKRRRAIRDTWLEYSYGWAPLVADVHSGAKALARYNTYEPDWQRVNAYGRDESVSYSNRSVGSYSSWQCELLDTTRNEVDIKYYGTVRVKSADDKYKSIPRIFGVSWSDVIPAAWELIPYSFLVDYFSNAGDWIEAHTFPRANFRWLAKGTKKARTVVRTLRPIKLVTYGTGWSYVSTFARPSEQTAYRRILSRQPYFGTLIPDFRLRVPGMGLKWLNMAALLRLR